MAFKIKPFYSIDNTPIYFVPEEDNQVAGRANLNGSITINDNVKDPKAIQEIIRHE